MKQSSVRKTPLSETLPPSKQLSAPPTPNVVMNEMVENLIRERAYQLYAMRGFQDGHAQADWFQAESDVLRELAKDAA